MKQNDLLLRQHCRKQTRLHDEKVMTLASNVRWLSDHFDIRCWDGDGVRVGFSLDTHDREVLRWKATTASVAEEMVRDLIAESVEYCFGDSDRLPRPIQ
jgi:transposase InsO family protein